MKKKPTCYTLGVVFETPRPLSPAERKELERMVKDYLGYAEEWNFSCKVTPRDAHITAQ